MRQTHGRSIAIIAAAVFIGSTGLAGNLDDAPFRIVAPDANWRLDDTTRKEMDKGVFLIASLTTGNTELRSILFVTDLPAEQHSIIEEARDRALGITIPSTLDQFSNGVRKSLVSLGARITSDSEIKFLGYPAHVFEYEATIGNQTSYHEDITLVVGNKAWQIACVGPPDQKIAVQQLLGCYHSK